MFPIDAFRNTLTKAVAIFERHCIRFHLTGGLTSVLYGEPRLTQDIDIVTDNRAISENLDAFLDSLSKSDFLFDMLLIQILDRRFHKGSLPSGGGRWKNGLFAKNDGTRFRARQTLIDCVNFDNDPLTGYADVILKPLVVFHG